MNFWIWHQKQMQQKQKPTVGICQTKKFMHSKWNLPQNDKTAYWLGKIFAKPMSDKGLISRICGASLVTQIVKNLPAMQETQVWYLGWENLLEKEMATHSSILAWRIPWTEKTGGLQSMGLQRVGHYWVTNTTTTTSKICKEIIQLNSKKKKKD